MRREQACSEDDSNCKELVLTIFILFVVILLAGFIVGSLANWVISDDKTLIQCFVESYYWWHDFFGSVSKDLFIKIKDLGGRIW